MPWKRLPADEHAEQRCRLLRIGGHRRRSLGHLDHGVGPALGRGASQVADRSVLTQTVSGLGPVGLEELVLDAQQLAQPDLAAEGVQIEVAGQHPVDALLGEQLAA